MCLPSSDKYTIIVLFTGSGMYTASITSCKVTVPLDTKILEEKHE